MLAFIIQRLKNVWILSTLWRAASFVAAWFPSLVIYFYESNSLLYSYKADFIQSVLSAGKKLLASQFNFTYRYIDDVLSINNPDFENYLDQMYTLSLR